MTTDHSDDTDLRGLLAGILDNPHDDQPRIAYSDRLEELGDVERAEFIRSMIAVWNHDGQGSSGTLRHEQHKQHDTRIESWFSRREWGPALEKMFGWNWSRKNCAQWKQWDLRRDVVATWSRGFISEIHLTCAEFCGGPCLACDVLGRDICPRCGGTGRTEGVARELFQRHPITRVVLTDKQALLSLRIGNVTHFGWCDEARNVNRSGVLPLALISKMPAGVSWVNEFRRWFATEADALNALSDACVSHGRTLAGLGPLPVAKET